ncbi:unnamed protein product [Brassica rapa]|uniref:Uncharacterized protein n=1 Tax=Brassica campestris TaxID=3711 RepID=A0A8D9H3W6_BRACM|nr:unnamed protein product [Brassica rapa]
MSYIRCKHLPKVQEVFDVHWDGKKASLFVQSYLTEVLSQLNRLWAAVTRYHHQLQGFIKHEK